MTIRIAPSLLAADFGRLADEVRRIETAGADWLHLDVMDGHFVPNLTIGPAIVAAMRKITRLELDTHLMLSRPGDFLEVFARAGSTIITVHAEAVPELGQTLDRIHALGVKAGVAVKPLTPWEGIIPFLAKIDLILFMTVEPGFGGQAFMPEVMPKIKAARDYLTARGLSTNIQVDGGISPANAHDVIQAGANVLVAGTAVFGQPDPADVIRRLRAA